MRVENTKEHVEIRFCRCVFGKKKENMWKVEKKIFRNYFRFRDRRDRAHVQRLHAHINRHNEAQKKRKILLFLNIFYSASSKNTRRKTFFISSFEDFLSSTRRAKRISCRVKIFRKIPKKNYLCSSFQAWNSFAKTLRNVSNSRKLWKLSWKSRRRKSEQRNSIRKKS